MSNESPKVVEKEQYSLASMQKRNVDEMNKGSMYPSWNNKSNTEKYPSGMQGAKMNKQPMGKA